MDNLISKITSNFESLGLIIIALVLLMIAIKMVITADKRLREYKRYEFKNRNAGGTVQFESFEASEKHNNGKKLSELQKKFAGLVLLTSFALLAVGLIHFS